MFTCVTYTNVTCFRHLLQKHTPLDNLQQQHKLNVNDMMPDELAVRQMKHCIKRIMQGARSGCLQGTGV